MVLLAQLKLRPTGATSIAPYFVVCDMSLQFEGLHKSFGAVRALEDVSFGVDTGATHAVVGENGAGKSTLLKILAGIVRPDRGHVRLDEAVLDAASPREALAAGIGMVFQERLAFPNLTVAGNIFAGRELTGRGGRLDERTMIDRTRVLLARLQVPVSPTQRMEHVSAAYAQLVQVARALAFDCRVLVLDEPTTSLTDAEVDHLFGVLADLKARGVTIVFVSHRLPEVFRLCDRITVLRDGRYVGTYDRATSRVDDIVRAMVGREPPVRVERPDRASAPAAGLQVRGLTRRSCFDDVSVDVAAGEIVGIFGLVGSGRSELLETIAGLARPDAGEVRIDGQPVVFHSVRDAARAGVSLVPEDRQRQGLHFNLRIRDNIVLPRAAAAGLGRIRRHTEAQLATQQVGALNIKTPSIDRWPDALSGGNQQKVVAAKSLATLPRVLLLDEPTKGVDVGAKFEIHNIIRTRANAGVACLIVSSDLPEVLALADRVVVMRQGQVRGELAAGATEEDVMRLAAHSGHQGMQGHQGDRGDADHA
jgi:ABC-type sugar transport system ATPase subunit